MSNELKRGGFRPAPPTSIPTAPPPPPIGLVYQPACCLRADRAERILAALREPSEAVVDAAYEAYQWWDTSLGAAIRAAVAAAEKEAAA